MDARSSAILALPVPNVSTPSEGTAQIAWICWPVTTSGRSVGVASVPHQPAANAPGEAQSAAPAMSRARNALRTRRPPQLEAVLGAGAEAAQVSSMQVQDGRRCGSTEEHHGERVAVD